MGVFSVRLLQIIIFFFRLEVLMVKIMVVDDDKMITSLLGKLLASDGYQTVIINDSSKVMDAAIKSKPDFFLLDLMMPQPDGFKLCRMLRELPEFAYTPIIIVTALDDTDSRIVAFGAGANDYITKPFLPSDLISRIRNLL